MRFRKARRMSEQEYKKVLLLTKKGLSNAEIKEITGWSASIVAKVKKYKNYEEFQNRNAERAKKCAKIDTSASKNGWSVAINAQMSFEKAQKVVDFLNEFGIKANLSIKEGE